MINNKEKNFISVVVYIHNNEKEILPFLNNINKTLENNFSKYEIICVNDASTDNTLLKIKEFTKTTNSGSIINIINMSHYQGIELSMNAGVDLAIGDFVYEFDYILQEYREDIVLNTYYKALEGYDIVSANSKENKKKASTIFYKLFNKFSDTEYKIQTEEFRILSRRAINRIHSISTSIPYRKAIYANCGLKMYYLEYRSSKSKNNHYNKEVHKNRMETAINSLILFTNIGYKFSMTMTIIMILVTIFVALYTILVFLKGMAIEGWTTTMLFLSFSFFGLFTIMTIVIKYLELLINLNFKRNHYIVESIEKAN